MGIAGAGLISVAAWGQPRLIGSETIAGPSWLLALLPLLLGGPLLARRRAPLLMWLAVWAGIALLSLLADNSVRGLACSATRMRRPAAPRSRASASCRRWPAASAPRAWRSACRSTVITRRCRRP